MTDNPKMQIPGTAALSDRSIVLIGLMGAGKTAIGKRLGAELGLPFFDADQEIERAAGASIAEIFNKHGEAHFRAGEKRVIERLLSGPPIVLAPGGGAFMDPETRALIRERAISIWLRCPLAILLRRVQGRSHRPLLNVGDPAEILSRLSAERSPLYAQADIIIDGSEDPPHVTMTHVKDALASYRLPSRINVSLSAHAYDVLIGERLIARAGQLLAPLLAYPRAVIVTDTNIAALHLPELQASLSSAGITNAAVVVAPGEHSKSFAGWQMVVEEFLTQKIDRQTTIIALGGGVIGDLAGFAAAATLRGLNFVQMPTTLLAQVDSSVGGKTGINAPHGKNLIGAFHQPITVLADTSVLKTLPARELRAGYAEIVKAGLIADAPFYTWCEREVEHILGGSEPLLIEAIERAVRFKANVVGRDERETQPNDGRALLNLGHTFAHALEAETGYGDKLLHGEAVAVGLVLATHLSAAMGLCTQEEASRVAAHMTRAGLPTFIEGLSAENLINHMSRDKKLRGGKLHFVLIRGIGRAFTMSEVPEKAVLDTLRANGAS
jgi:shikimate kinase/3-dehydroquinate synthase